MVGPSLLHKDLESLAAKPLAQLILQPYVGGGVLQYCFISAYWRLRPWCQMFLTLTKTAQCFDHGMGQLAADDSTP